MVIWRTNWIEVNARTHIPRRASLPTLIGDATKQKCLDSYCVRHRVASGEGSGAHRRLSERRRWSSAPCWRLRSRPGRDSAVGNQPRIAADLRDNPELLYDPNYRDAHPALDQYL